MRISDGELESLIKAVHTHLQQRYQSQIDKQSDMLSDLRRDVLRLKYEVRALTAVSEDEKLAIETERLLA